MHLNVNAGTLANGIQHQLIRFLKRLDELGTPAGEWIGGRGFCVLLALASLLLIFLLLPFPLHCGVYVLFSETG